MARRGRKPLELDHVQQLQGSEFAKQRMMTLLMTLQGSCTIEEARSQLNLSESQLHAVRQRWLQGAVELLEPRAPGRPPRDRHVPAERIEELQGQIRDLQRELALAKAQCEVTQVMAHTGSPKRGCASS